ncbi:MAG: hypothetical protein H0W02_21065 [Ktedonobacteraceae bacterium]|nr:hypothetical protein [Ktedonobacteraceae bacterium]
MLFTTIRDWLVAALLLSLLSLLVGILLARHWWYSFRFRWLALCVVPSLGVFIWSCTVALRAFQFYQHLNPPYHGITQYIMRIERTITYTQISLVAGQSELLLSRIQECALPIAQCESMALDAAAGEQELHYTASRQQHLWALLGMKMGQDMIREPVQPISEEHMQPLPDEATTRQKSRVGEQQPVRLEVGES